MKRLVYSLVVFLAVCAMGAITMIAAGVKWGTIEAGSFVGGTFTFAIIAVIVFQSFEEMK